jgi:3-hydroxy-9,10-secoandrosta-1,3,5(10)-triene-9,17-dione monooxygenase
VTPETAPNRETILARARALVPVLAANAEATERYRALLPEVHAALVDAGLFRILCAPRLGGLDLGALTHLEAAATLAEGCGSTAWVQCLVGYHNFLVGWYPSEAQDEVTADGAPLFAGLVMGPPVTAERVGDTIRLTGRFPYVSGIDYASCAMLSARDPDNPARVLTCLIPRRDLAIDDDWHAMGMRGTGSKSVLLDGLVVPPHRVLSFAGATAAGIPGAAVNKGPLYDGRINGTLFAVVVATPALGLVECALEAYRARLHTRWNGRMPSSQIDWPSSQARLGRARAQLDAVRASFFATVRGFLARFESGVEVTVEHRVHARMAMVEAVDACSRIVCELFADAGTGVMVGDNALQRAFRDIHMLRSHFVLTPAFAAENAGRALLGLPPKPPFV